MAILLNLLHYYERKHEEKCLRKEVNYFLLVDNYWFLIENHISTNTY